jgi:hypothetical protein
VPSIVASYQGRSYSAKLQPSCARGRVLLTGCLSSWEMTCSPGLGLQSLFAFTMFAFVNSRLRTCINDNTVLRRSSPTAPQHYDHSLCRSSKTPHRPKSIHHPWSVVISKIVPFVSSLKYLPIFPTSLLYHKFSYTFTPSNPSSFPTDQSTSVQPKNKEKIQTEIV